MKIKAGEVINAVEVAASMRQDKMPLRAASWLVLLSKRLEPTYQVVIERRNEIVKKYANGENQVQKENIQAYMADVQPFLLEEVEVDVAKVSVSIFETVQISPAALTAFDPFLEPLP